jgi:hypothetical protein
VLLAELCRFASWFRQLVLPNGNCLALAKSLGLNLAELSVKCVGILEYNPDMARLLVPFIMFR